MRLVYYPCPMPYSTSNTRLFKYNPRRRDSCTCANIVSVKDDVPSEEPDDELLHKFLKSGGNDFEEKIPSLKSQSAC